MKIIKRKGTCRLVTIGRGGMTITEYLLKNKELMKTEVTECHDYVSVLQFDVIPTPHRRTGRTHARTTKQ